jgi:hypothetical protein
MAIFELIACARARGAPDTILAMEARLAGFILAIVLMVLIPIIFGSPARLFCDLCATAQRKRAAANLMATIGRTVRD